MGRGLLFSAPLMHSLDVEVLGVRPDLLGGVLGCSCRD